MKRLAGVAGLLAALLACQEPFGVDRHDLEGDRVARIGTSPAQAPVGATITAEVALVADDKPWTDEPAAFAWHWVDDDDPDTIAAIDPDDEADATGPRPTLVIPDTDVTRLALVTTFPSGVVRRGFLDVPTGETREGVEVTGFVFTPDEPIASGEHRRIEATVAPDEPLPRIRWMTVGGRGTFLEEDRVTTRWDAAIVVRDDGEVESEDPIADGPVTFVALALDPLGGTALRAEERWVGDAPTGLFTSGGRWIAADTAPDSAGPWHGVLALDDASPTGLALTGLAAGPLLGLDPWGTSALPCTVPVSGPFDPDWLFRGLCTRAQVAGQTVAVEVP